MCGCLSSYTVGLVLEELWCYYELVKCLIYTALKYSLNFPQLKMWVSYRSLSLDFLCFLHDNVNNPVTEELTVILE